MEQQNNNVCAGGPKLIFACSGAADVGAIADQAARKLTKDGKGQMFCLAGIGAHLEPIMNKTRQASRVLVIDGCPLNCAKGCLDQAGFFDYQHLQLADIGMEKGKSPASQDNIQKACSAAEKRL